MAIATCSAYRARSEVRIQLSVPVEIATVMGLQVLIITVVPVVWLALLVVCIYAGHILIV